MRDHAESFSALMASQSSLGTWPVRFDGSEREEASGRLVSGGFFDVLGVGSALGRVFTAAEDRTETPVAVVSYSYWQRRFGGRPDVLGKTLTVGNATLTIIGVTPRGFIGETSGQRPDLWLPLRMHPTWCPATSGCTIRRPPGDVASRVWTTGNRACRCCRRRTGQRDLSGGPGIVLAPPRPADRRRVL